ncbi:PspC domain-containing protein [Micromonospora chersina]
MTSTHPSQAPYKQLRRPATDRMVAGVASGLGRYFAVDPTLVRVGFAVATLLTGGLAALAYPIMWFLMPEEPAGAPAWPHPPGTAPGWPPVPPAHAAPATPEPAPRPAPQPPIPPTPPVPPTPPAA